MKNYKVLKQQEWHSGDCSLVPIRYEDRHDIMKWRNEQIYHLRQNRPLTADDQERYFDQIVSKLFDQEQPGQILFSFLENGKCIGYGGLVHINWIDKHAEVSFIMATELEKDHFQRYWKAYLDLISKVAFNDLSLHKLFTYAFDIRPHLYPALESAGFRKEAVLKEHCLFQGAFVDVLIHARYNRLIQLREATEDDLEVTFKWASNTEVRKYSINQSTISLEGHSNWFRNRIKNPNCNYTIAEYNTQAVGSFRLDIDEDGNGLISYLLDPSFHGLGLGKRLLEKGIELANSDNRIKSVIGDVMEANEASIKIFEKLGFEKVSESQGLIRFQLGTS